MTEQQLHFHDLGLTANDLFCEMGYGTSVPTPELVAETEALWQQALDRVHPRYSYLVSQGRLDTQLHTLSIGDAHFHLGPIIARQLRDSQAFALFICTAGTDFALMQQEHQGDLLHTYLLDTLGTLIAERTADLLEQSLQASIDKLHWHHTNRFSPGYCQWHVSEQQQLFPLFGGHTCGVTLTPSSLMLPIKSVSGIIGLGPTVRHLPYSCGLCTQQNCFRRHSSKQKQRPAV